MPTFYGAIDLVQNELRNAKVQNQGSAPGTPVTGQLWYDSANNILKWWNGAAWISAQGGAGAIPATTVTTSAVGDGGVVGTATTYAREDHKHGRESFGSVTLEQTFGTSPSNGSQLTVARSDHQHGNPTHVAADHSTIPISALAAATSFIDMGNHQINNVADPANPQDAATKNYVDNAINGLSWKDMAAAATTANIALTGTQTIDGVALVQGQRCLVKNQTDPTQNGLYRVNTAAWTRTTDADASTEMEGMAVYIDTGTTQGDTSWVLTTNAPIVVGTTSLAFTQFAGPGTVTAGAGMTQTGNVLNVIGGTGIVVGADLVSLDTAYTDTRYINASGGDTFTGTILGGSSGTKVGVSNSVDPEEAYLYGSGIMWTGVGGLGLKGSISLDGPGSGDTYIMRVTDPVGVNINSPQVTVAQNPTVALGVATKQYVDGLVATGAKKFAVALAGTSSPETITHNLNTQDIMLMVHNGASPYTSVEVDWDATTVNTAVIRYNPNLGAGYRVVVMG